MTLRPVVVWPGESRWSLDRLLPALRSSLEGRVQSAWLIGSHATGTANGESDIDLILVCRTDAAWPDRGEQFADLFEEFEDIDLLVYTPEEWEKLQAGPTPFLEHAARTWKQVI